jgi:propanediol dehydratase small subunit
LSKSIPDKLKSKTGKTLNEITLTSVIEGDTSADDIKISREALLLQGEIAEKEGRYNLKGNFQRAAELIDVPDDMILKIYGQLRPYRATKEELIAIALELKINIMQRFVQALCWKRQRYMKKEEY